MTATAIKFARASLCQWAKWKNGRVEYETAYRSPPNVIYRLMSNDFGVGGRMGRSSVPYAVFRGGVYSGVKRSSYYEHLDKVIDALPVRRKETIYLEFLGKGSQKDKAKLMNVEIQTYKNQLNLALKQILDFHIVKNFVNTA